MSTEDNKALVRRFFAEIYNKGNVAAVDELVAPNIVGHFDSPTNVPVTSAVFPCKRIASSFSKPFFTG